MIFAAECSACGVIKRTPEYTHAVGEMVVHSHSPDPSPVQYLYAGMSQQEFDNYPKELIKTNTSQDQPTIKIRIRNPFDKNDYVLAWIEARIK